jgi:DNA-binding FrmR family transcriptional regulator
VLQFAAARFALDRAGNVIVASSLRDGRADARLGRSQVQQVNAAPHALVSLRS